MLGYELATRAGIALHATASDYHCSGAWNALGCAALGGRLMDFDERRMRDALGIAEYLGPRGQILRVCAQPTMLKDGSGWGAHAGVTAALLAREGFTGAPALTVEADEVKALWSDLGQRWRIREQYFKAYPVCRWAQPAVEAALALKRAHRFDAEDIVAIGIESFREAIDLGSQCRCRRRPTRRNTACRFRWRRRWFSEAVGAAEIGAAGPRRSASRAAARDVLADARTTNSRAAFRPSAGRGSASHSPTAARSSPSRRRRAAGPRIRCPTTKSAPSTASWPSRSWGRAASSRIAALAASLPVDATALPALIDELLSPAS